MKKFIVLYHAPADLVAQTQNLSPEEQAKGMEAWMQWAEQVGDSLEDLGAPLINGQQMRQGGAIAGSNKDVTGYSILKAESLADAEALLQNHPHLGWNPDATIEVHETMELPGT